MFALGAGILLRNSRWTHSVPAVQCKLLEHFKKARQTMWTSAGREKLVRKIAALQAKIGKDALVLAAAAPRSGVRNLLDLSDQRRESHIPT